ncbi:hypothetical protein K504DRAFT_464312 [Pleomassaria siparia CBS 279.74]|uniref:Inositol hexakisphosphate and diphosphoinositol-pentakisphosphate kinase n=1 Tax=Pleomassaria siparia CBS 279.74 TaxID=1314801 RepID=A0A6G1KHC8_9PLEO|nr:hypothetical protein K504DRAFT_464312 [Pleomassaria siparia CBS 279.74]
MEQLSRTVSAESSKHLHLLSSGIPTSPASRKARPLEPETGPTSNNEATTTAIATVALTAPKNVERSSVSMPPPASKSIARSFPSRRPSRASDSSVGFLDSDGRHGSAIDESDTTPTASTQYLTLQDTLHRSSRDPDVESNRMSFSSLYSLGSVIYNSAARGLSGPGSVASSEPEVRMEGPSQGTTTTATSSLSVTTTSSLKGSLGPTTSPTQLLSPKDQITPTGLPPTPQNGPTFISPSPSLNHTPAPSPSTQPSTVRRSRSRTSVRRRISGSTGASSSPGSRDMSHLNKPFKGSIGLCALESKARSKPARSIFGKLNGEFDVKVFGDKIILDEEVTNWPVCDFLVSFFSDGFPLDKAIEYARLRKPFCVNDLPMQQVLWDRRLCLSILDKLQVPSPKRVEVSRDGGPKLQSVEVARTLFEKTGITLQGAPDGTGGGLAPPKKVEMLDDGNTICVDGVSLTKPFVEKPVSGEDHNVYIYYHKKDGGGGRRLFRKINNKSSEGDNTLDVPRSIIDPESSYIYEQFLQVENSEDVKAYTVGPNYCHAETRKSPVVDGLVKRNPSGKEVRYVTKLNDEEASMAAKISEGFGQRVCGFDLLRCGERSYVIDVNGWSFVKDNPDYYDKAANIMREMFLNEIQRKEKENQSIPSSGAESAEKLPISKKSTGSTHRQTLKGIFKSPSMSKLIASHHPHIPHIRHSGTMPSSPDMSLSSTPLAASPSFEKPYSAATSSTPSDAKSEADIPTATTVNDADDDAQTSSSEHHTKVVPPPASKSQWKLKGVVSVIRHADRTPKQKFKYTFSTKPFIDLLKGHQAEVLLIGEQSLRSVSDAVKEAMEEGVEDPKKLRELNIYLNKKGAWPGTKVQIKPMFRKRRKEELLPGEIYGDFPETPKSPALLSGSPNPELDLNQTRSDSMSGLTLSRISAVENNLILDKLQLIIKWGGEPTHSARHQAQDMGDNMRKDLFLMNRDILNDVSIFSSSERRVTTSAQIFGAAFLEQDKFPSERITVRKDLLDDSNAAKDEMDKVKKSLKTLLRAGDKAPPQFAWPDGEDEPYIVVRKVVELMKFHQKVMNHNYKKIESGAVSSLSAIGTPSADNSAGSTANSLSQATSINQIQPRWCCNEGPELFKERWEKLFKEFEDADKVDPSKISELYDTMKFDALHNRNFLEWVFTPDAAFLDEGVFAESSKISSSDNTVKPPAPAPASAATDTPTSTFVATETQPKVESKDAGTGKSGDRASVVHRMGFRRRSEIVPKSMPTPMYPHESFFKLYTGVNTAAASKAQLDARLVKLRDMYHMCKILFDYIGPQEYGINNEEKLEIGLLTSLPLLKEIVEDLEELQASDGPKCFFYFTKESHIYTLLNCILEGGVETKVERNRIPELDYLSQIGFELYESENAPVEGASSTFNYSIKITLSPGCHAHAPLDVQLDSRHMIGFAPRKGLTVHHDWKMVLETLRAKFNAVKLPKSFLAINLSERTPDTSGRSKGKEKATETDMNGDADKDKDVEEAELPPPALEHTRR